MKERCKDSLLYLFQDKTGWKKCLKKMRRRVRGERNKVLCIIIKTRTCPSSWFIFFTFGLIFFFHSSLRSEQQDVLWEMILCYYICRLGFSSFSFTRVYSYRPSLSDTVRDPDSKRSRQFSNRAKEKTCIKQLFLCRKPVHSSLQDCIKLVYWSPSVWSSPGNEIKSSLVFSINTSYYCRY